MFSLVDYFLQFEAGILQYSRLLEFQIGLLTIHLC